MTTFWPNFFFEPGKAENVSRVLVLVAGLFTFKVPDVSSDVNSRNMVGNKAKISTQTQLKWRSLCAPLDIVPLLPLSFFSIFGVSLFFLGLFDFFFLFFYIYSSIRSTKEVTTENMSLN